MKKTNRKDKPKVSIRQMVMLVLCVYVLGALFADTAFKLDPQTHLLLHRIDTLICFIFFGDFIYNLYTAKSKWAYLKWGWIDLLSSIPTFPFLRVGRFVQVVRILRVLRGIRSVRVIVAFLFANRAKGTFATVALITFVLLIFSSIAMLNLETSPEANIRTASDALWWSFVTITTVGYGDYYPVTKAGRMVAVVLMISGVGLFGTFAAYVASLFMRQDEEACLLREQRMLEELRAIRERLDQLEPRGEHAPKNRK